MKMAQGITPTDACQSVVREISSRQKASDQEMFEIGLIALNKEVRQNIYFIVLITHNFPHTSNVYI
jgi:hypothetical protein